MGIIPGRPGFAVLQQIFATMGEQQFSGMRSIRRELTAEN
jgi:hypothetical protein